MERDMALEFNYFQTGRNSLGIGRKIWLTDSADWNISMVLLMKENMKIIAL